MIGLTLGLIVPVAIIAGVIFMGYTFRRRLYIFISESKSSSKLLENSLYYRCKGWPKLRGSLHGKAILIPRLRTKQTADSCMLIIVEWEHSEVCIPIIIYTSNSLMLSIAITGNNYNILLNFCIFMKTANLMHHESMMTFDP